MPISSILFDIMSLRRVIAHIRGHRVNFPNRNILQSLKIFFNSANSAEPDEMQHYAAFHLGLHCLHGIRLGVSRNQLVN